MSEPAKASEWVEYPSLEPLECPVCESEVPGTLHEGQYDGEQHACPKCGQVSRVKVWDRTRYPIDPGDQIVDVRLEAVE